MSGSLVQVTQQEFFAKLRADPRDVMPRAERERTFWEDQRTRVLWGVSEPGYAGPYGEPERWFVVTGGAS